ncbi:hypothetical protein AgCh_017292 [Apium graveolens]
MKQVKATLAQVLRNVEEKLISNIVKNHFGFRLTQRTVVSIPNGTSALATKEAVWGLARYVAISQVPIVEPKIMLDGEHGIERTFEVAQAVWDKVFFYLA